MEKDVMPVERIEQAILLIRGQKVLLDRDLAVLYGVPTKSLNLAVKRNRDRFPEDFMFRLSAEETRILRFQFETSSSRWGGLRYCPSVPSRKQIGFGVRERRARYMTRTGR